MKNLKRYLFIIMIGVLFLPGCGTSDGNSKSESGNNELVVWTFTAEIETIINDYYIPSNPDLDYTIRVVTVPTELFERKLDSVLGSNNAPDVVALESAFVKKYVESGKLASLEEFGLLDKASDTFDYIKEVGTTSDGELVALAWQSAPGAFFYRASLAEEYLGLSTTEEVQSAISDFNKFYETAKTLKENSNGSIYMIASVSDLARPFYGQREHGWVEDGKLIIDDSLYDLLELSRKFVSEGLTLDAEAQSETWHAGMSSDEIFGYSLPTWALHHWLRPNSEGTTAGDWRMVQGPTSWFWGGTWLGVTETSQMKEEAAELISFITTDEDFLRSWAEDSGDFIGNQNVVDAIKENSSDDLLGGQNSYATFAEMAQNIDASILTAYDRTIESLFLDNVLTPYSKGEIELEEAIENFKNAVFNAFPDVEVR